MFGRLTDFVSSPRGKWMTLVVWVVVAGLLISQLPRLDEATENEQALFLPRDAEATRAYEFAREHFPSTGTPVLIVFREPGGLGSAAYAAATEMASWLSGPDRPENVTQVLSPDPVTGPQSGLVSADGTTMYVFAEVVGEPADPAFIDTIEAIRDRSASADLPGVEIAVGGPGGLIVDLVGVFSQIDTLLLLVTVLLVLALLVIIYRSPIMATVPLLGVGLVFQLAGAIAAWYALQFDVPVSGQTTGIMTVVLFGTGTDYVLFVSARFREELTRHEDRHEAMRRTMRGVGGAVASAGVTILVACAALGLATLRSYQALGPVIALAVALMMLAALTLIPAVLTVLGRRAFWPMQPRLESTTAAQVDWRRSVYGRVGAVVLRRPGLTLAATVLGLGLLLTGLIPYRTNYDQLESLPGNAESVRSFQLLRSGFPAGELSPTRLYVSLPPGAGALDPASLEQLDILTLELAGHPAVADASGPSRPLGVDGPPASVMPEPVARRFVSADGRAARIDIVLNDNPFSRGALDAVPQLRTLARSNAEALGLPPDGNTRWRGHRRGLRHADRRRQGLVGGASADPVGNRARAGAPAALSGRAAVPDGHHRLHLLRHPRLRSHGLRRRIGSCRCGAGGPVLPVRVPECAERRLQHLPDVAHPRGGKGSSPSRGDPPCPRAHRPRHHIRGDHPRRHLLRPDDATVAGPAPARIRGRGRCVDRHLHHAHLDRAGGGLPRGPTQLVALPHALLTVGGRFRAGATNGCRLEQPVEVLLEVPPPPPVRSVVGYEPDRVRAVLLHLEPSGQGHLGAW